MGNSDNVIGYIEYLSDGRSGPQERPPQRYCAP